MLKSSQILLICNAMFVAALLVFRGLRLIAWAIYAVHYGNSNVSINSLIATMREDNLNEYDKYIGKVYKNIKEREKQDAEFAQRLSEYRETE